MTTEDALKYLQTRQLTDYREDWPNGQKGCLFFVGFDRSPGSWPSCYLRIADFHWRKGAKWQDFPLLLPYEQKMLYGVGTGGYSFKYKVSNFGAFLLAIILDSGVPSDSDLHVLWDVYLQECTKNLFISPTPYEYSHFSSSKSIFSKDVEELLIKLGLFSNEVDSPATKFFQLWENAISFWVDKFIAEMTPAKQLFECNMYFAVEAECECEVPVHVYDQAESEFDEGVGIVRCDTLNYYEDGTETYRTNDVLLGFDAVSNSLVFHYSVPDYYRKEAIDFDYDEDDGTFTATSFDEEFANICTINEDPICVYGLTACVIGYSAIGMVIRAYQSNKKWSALSKLLGDSNHWHITDIDIYVTKSVYDTYFDYFCKEYELKHVTDSDFIALGEQKRLLLLLNEAIKSEQENIRISTDIYEYLTEQQCKQLRKDVNNYIKYLQDRIADLTSSPSTIVEKIEHHYHNNAVHEDHSKNIILNKE